ncbi:hypothetical protein [Lysobacter olei]
MDLRLHSVLRPILDALDDLEVMIPELRAAYTDSGARLAAFAALAGPIRNEAARMERTHDLHGCCDMVSHRIDRMLLEAGWMDEAGTAIDSPG